MTKDEAGQVLPDLRPREVERLTRELVRLGSVDSTKELFFLEPVSTEVR